MKKIVIWISALLVMAVLCRVSFMDGDSNMDGDGGDTGNAIHEGSYWLEGQDGVRITLVNAKTGKKVGRSVDFANNEYQVQVHFGYRSKLDYLKGKKLSEDFTKYKSVGFGAGVQIPLVVRKSGGSNIAEVRQFFSGKGRQQMIASKCGGNYEAMKNGKYLVMIEPVAYVMFKGRMYALTATEASLFNQLTAGTLRWHLGSVTSLNLPLAMFLEKYDKTLGIHPYIWDGRIRIADDVIFQKLGIGAIRFVGSQSGNDTPEGGQGSQGSGENNVIFPSTGSEYTYRANTRVITSVNVTSTEEMNKDNPCYVTFDIGGESQTKEIYIPKDGSSLAWVEWKTPNTSGEVVISISSNCLLDRDYIIATIETLKENVPPDPQANDRNDHFKRAVVETHMFISFFAFMSGSE